MDLENESNSKLVLSTISTKGASDQLSRLLDQSFSISEPSHFFDDFPVWDPQFAPESVIQLGIFQSEKLVSTAGVRLAEIKVPSGRSFSVALIGAVATHPDWQNQGLA